MAKYVCQMAHVLIYGMDEHAQTESLVSTIIQYLTLIKRDQINNVETTETITGIDVIMIVTIGTEGMVTITVIGIEIDVDLVRTEAEDHTRKEVTEAKDTPVLTGEAEETVPEVATDEAQLRNETQGIHVEDLLADRLEATTRKDHSHQEVTMHNEEYVPTICEENAKASSVIEDHILSLASTGQKENVVRENGVHGLI